MSSMTLQLVPKVPISNLKEEHVAGPNLEGLAICYAPQ